MRSPRFTSFYSEHELNTVLETLKTESDPRLADLRQKLYHALMSGHNIPLSVLEARQMLCYRSLGIHENCEASA